MRSLRTLMKKAHLFRCARIPHSNIAKTGVLEWWSGRALIAIPRHPQKGVGQWY